MRRNETKVGDAHAYIEMRKNIGKVVIVPDNYSAHEIR